MDIPQNVQSNTAPPEVSSKVNNSSIIIPVLVGFSTVIVIAAAFYFLFSKKSTITSQTFITTSTALPSVAPTTIPSTPVPTPIVSATPLAIEKMIDCGMAKEPTCFLNRMNVCLPVTVKMTGSDNTTEIEMTILGIENEKCHFQRKLNGILNLNCYFPKGTLSWDTIDQTFGNDKGLQKVVDDNCKSGW